MLMYIDLCCFMFVDILVIYVDLCGLFLHKKHSEQNDFWLMFFVNIWAPHVDFGYHFGAHRNQKSAESEPKADQMHNKNDLGHKSVTRRCGSLENSTFWRHIVDFGSNVGAHCILKGSPNPAFS